MVYGTVCEELLVLSEEKARELARTRIAVEFASTWGEFYGLLPPGVRWELQNEIENEYGDEDHEFFASLRRQEPELPWSEAMARFRQLAPNRARSPLPDDKFQPLEQITLYADSDWPEWPGQAMEKDLPKVIIEKFGRFHPSFLDGDLLKLEASRQNQILWALRSLGKSVVKNEPLLLAASGVFSRLTPSQLRAVASSVLPPFWVKLFEAYLRRMAGRGDNWLDHEPSRRTGFGAGHRCLPTMFGDVDVGELAICGQCHQLKGAFREVEYNHHEEEDGMPIGYRPWNLYCGCTGPEAQTHSGLRIAELCRCCAAQLLPSGTKFSVWFCEECKEAVRRLNWSLQTYLIPIGPHSLQGGIQLSGLEAKNPGKVAAFAKRWNSLFARMDSLGDFALATTAERVANLGLDPGQDVPLLEYLDRLDRNPPDKTAAFHRLREYFRVNR